MKLSYKIFCKYISERQLRLMFQSAKILKDFCDKVAIDISTIEKNVILILKCLEYRAKVSHMKIVTKKYFL